MFVEVAASFGLTVNFAKTKVMGCGVGLSPEDRLPLSVLGKAIEYEESFVYLDSLLSPEPAPVPRLSAISPVPLECFRHCNMFSKTRISLFERNGLSTKRAYSPLFYMVPSAGSSLDAARSAWMRFNTVACEPFWEFLDGTNNFTMSPTRTCVSDGETLVLSRTCRAGDVCNGLAMSAGCLTIVSQRSYCLDGCLGDDLLMDHDFVGGTGSLLT